ncbi:hypothetical protein FO519_005702 [Halicephalobus sp. NKZ332]|nr:hypothetical protein FO519_005702 [Halicephalobus sp. NKZ332]
MKTLTIFVLGSLIAVSYCGILGIGKTQSAAVKGVLVCNGQPAENVKVKLYDEDRTDLDDLMSEGVTDNPKLNVYHDCNDESTPCLKKFSIVIPDTYIADGEEPDKVFDVGVLNLAGAFSGESRDCLN